MIAGNHHMWSIFYQYMYFSKFSRIFLSNGDLLSSRISFLIGSMAHNQEEKIHLIRSKAR